MLLNNEDVTAAIRTPEVSQAASEVSLVPAVRRAMVEKQREIGGQISVVMEGRDIGTVVFPEATVKIFLDAQPEERADAPRQRVRAAHRPGGATNPRARPARPRTRGIAPGASAGRRLCGHHGPQRRRGGSGHSENHPRSHLQRA